MKRLLWLFGLLFFFCTCQLLESKVTVNANSTVVYQGADVSKREATRLGAVLLDHGYFNNIDQRTVYLRKKDNQYCVTFFMNKEAFLSDKENITAGLSVWRQWIQEYAFGYAPTLLIVADEEKQPLYQLNK